MIYEEKTLESQILYKGSILNLRRDKVLVVGDKESYREIIEHSGAVTIAPITDDGKMVLVKQYRKAAEKAVLETPAGKIESGENDAKLTAIRELKEETGYSAESVEYVSSFYPAIGYSEEIIHLFVARGLTPGETHFDDNEAIEVIEYDLKELKQMVLKGEIEDSKTIIAILIVAARMGI
ncbi:MAG: NUDIX hydrolase [Clostridiales bacterium]|nr:NUDIX hydrolase [Clostridiales bacterium]